MDDVRGDFLGPPHGRTPYLEYMDLFILTYLLIRHTIKFDRFYRQK